MVIPIGMSGPGLMSAGSGRAELPPVTLLHLSLGFLTLICDRFTGALNVATGTLDRLASGQCQKCDEGQEQSAQLHGMLSFVSIT
ncbi:MAG: hypothetical protein JWS10_3665 [Cypionkella sp.]|nr:hypothetical protein [Cypionkella sp.]